MTPLPDPGGILLPTGGNGTIRLADARRGLPQSQRSSVDLREVGVSGTRFQSGQVFEDPNVALQGQRGLRLLQQMSMDPTVAAALRAVELPIRAARWYVEPASEDPKHVAGADFVHWCLWEFGTQSMDDVLRQGLTMLWAGFSVSEIVYDIIEDGEYANYVGWDKLAWRHPLALALDTPIPTPQGWSTMGALQPGDALFDEGGWVRSVTAKSPVWTDHRCYEVVFSTGERIVADADHQWLARDQKMRNRGAAPQVVTTQEMAKVVKATKGGCTSNNWSIDGTESLRPTAVHKRHADSRPCSIRGCGRPSKARGLCGAHHERWRKGKKLDAPIALGTLPIDPYVLGFWLGDGCRGSAVYAVGPADEEAQAELLRAAGEEPRRLRQYHWTMSPATSTHRGRQRTGLRNRLAACGVLIDKHIPAAYLRSGPEDRLALLQGLMDSDGSVTPKGACQYDSTSPALMDGVKEIVRSLGGVGMSERWTTNTGGTYRGGKTITPRLPIGRLVFSFHLPAFRLARKVLKQRISSKRAQTHYIMAINEIPSVPTQCLTTDAPSSLFLAGRGMVPTHNSKYLWNVEEIDSRSGSRKRELVSMTQQAPPTYEQIVIPREKLLLWVHDMLGENFDGRSLMRQAYQPWVYKDSLRKIQAIGLERSYVGIPHISFPEDFSASEVAAATQIGQNMRVSENAAVIAPEHIGVALLTNKIEGRAMQDAIDHHDTAILMSILAQFVQLGTKGVGSYSLSTDQSELFLMAIGAVANYTAQVFNLAPGIPTLMRYNFAGVTAGDMPRLVHGPIGQRNFERLARGMAYLSQWGILTPDDSLEDWTREQMEMPERDNSVTDEALRSLIETVAGESQYPIGHPGPRWPIPGTSAGLGVTIGGQPVAPSAAADGSTPAGAEITTSAAQNGRQAFNEAWARRRWDRPQRRLTDVDRNRIRATETFAGALADMRAEVGQKPERPSDRLKRTRRPYQIRMSEPTPEEVVRKVNADAKAGRLRHAGAAESVVVPQHRVIASQYEGRLSEFIGGMGKRDAM